MKVGKTPEGRMPFGKHRGTPIDELPNSYLAWLATEATITAPWLRKAIEEECNARLDVGAGRTVRARIWQSVNDNFVFCVPASDSGEPFIRLGQNGKRGLGLPLHCQRRE